MKVIDFRGFCLSLMMASLSACNGFGSVSQLGVPDPNPNSEANLTVEATGEVPEGECGACFEIDSDKNITHIFVDTEGAENEVFLGFGDDELELVEKLHDNGGPCNHGDTSIDRDDWFVVPGNEEHFSEVLTVCVVVTDSDFDGVITVGAKSTDECQQDTDEVQCEGGEPCPEEPKECPEECPEH
jgi:hypothetical protein